MSDAVDVLWDRPAPIDDALVASVAAWGDALLEAASPTRRSLSIVLTDDAAIRKACDAATEGAAPLPGTTYKKTLLPVAIRRAVMAAANPGGDA